MSLFSWLHQSPNYNQLVDNEDEDGNTGEFRSLCEDNSSEINSNHTDMASLTQYGSLMRASNPGDYSSTKHVSTYLLTKELFKHSEAAAVGVHKRFYCLFLLFEMALVTFLWLICGRLDGIPFHSMGDEIADFNFKVSFFDIVVITLIRCILLLTCVGTDKFEVMVFVGTVFTSVYLVFKVFNSTKLDGAHAAMYVFLIVTSFFSCWIELIWPDNNKFRRKHPTNFEQGPLVIHETRPGFSIGGISSKRSSISSTTSAFRGVMPEEPDDDVLSLKAEDLFFVKKGQEVMLVALETLFSKGWAKEISKDNDLVESKTLDGTKIYRLLAHLNINVYQLMTLLYDDFETQPSWNSGVIKAQVVKIVDANTSIVYVISAAKGPVKSRDFVNLRHRAAVGTSLVIASISIETVLVPEDKAYVRGENGPGCFVLTPLDDDDSRCELRWLINSKLKGWIPQRAIDNAFGAFIITSIEEMRKRILSIPKAVPIPHSFSLRTLSNATSENIPNLPPSMIKSLSEIPNAPSTSQTQGIKSGGGNPVPNPNVNPARKPSGNSTAVRPSGASAQKPLNALNPTNVVKKK